MNRRLFLRSASGLALSICCARAATQVVPRPAPALERIGMGTVLFRHRFRQTRPKELGAGTAMLTLLDVPAYYRDRFGLRQVEFWSNHFESLERDYLQTLRERLQAADARLINVQVDSAYNLAAADEPERRRSVAHVKEWIDAVAFLGSSAIRINPGNGSVEQSIRSLREVNAHAQARGLPLLLENHFGIEMDPAVHLRLREAAGPDNVYTLPDFGNYAPEARYEALEKILPYAYLISAKVEQFNERMEHVSFDFDRCVRMAERAGFRGVYSVEQWSREHLALDYEKVGDWLIEHVRANLLGGA